MSWNFLFSMQFLVKPRSVIFPAMQCIKGNLFLLLSLIIQETFPTKPVGLVCPGLASPSCPALAVKHYTTGGSQSLSNKVLLWVIFMKKWVDIIRICIQIKLPKLCKIICAFFFLYHMGWLCLVQPDKYFFPIVSAFKYLNQNLLSILMKFN